MSEARLCALISLGCPKNLVDSEVMLGSLKEKGWQVTTDEAEADVLIVNTCAFIQEAVAESIETLRDVVRLKERAKCRAVIATGCLPSRNLSLLRNAVPGIDGFVGVNDLLSIGEVAERALAGQEAVAVASESGTLESLSPRLLATPPWTAYVKIAEGCNHTCSFCVIPRIRGEFRSRPMESVIRESRALAERGVKEVVLIAQDSTSYGIDLYGRRNLDELLTRLSEETSLQWIRLLYCYPSFVSERLIETIARHDNVCNYFDIPLQHVHPAILKRMGRSGSPETYRKLIQKIREAIPAATIRGTFIVGFPGETESHFRLLKEFVEEVKFDRLATFRYSREEGAASAEFPDQVPAEVAERRFDELMSLQQLVSLKKNRGKVGQRLRVLIEQIKDFDYGSHGATGRKKSRRAGCPIGIGRTEGDAPEIDANVLVPHCRSKPGEMILVEITEAREYDLVGRQILP